MKNQDTSCALEQSRYGGKLPLNHIEIKQIPFLNNSLATEPSSNLNLNWCIHSLIYLKSKTKRCFPVLLKVTVKGLTTVDISSTSETPLLSQSLQSLFSLDDLLFKNPFLGTCLKGIP